MAYLLRITRIACLATLAGSVAADDGLKIDGRWRFVSVEFAGMPVPGLEAAEVEFADGKKALTMPDGRVERGTYRLDTAKRPGRIDSTTEGKNAAEKGIYTVEGESLKLCLTTSGTRPEKFATQPGSDQLLIVLRRIEARPSDEKPDRKPNEVAANKATGMRSFRMGFTGFVYDLSLEAVAATHKFVRENGDIVAHHIEGAAWGEVLNDQPFPAALLKEWKDKKAASPPGAKVYLAVSPGRGELKVTEKAGPLPKELKGRAYDDPLVMDAYLKYCRRAIEFFEPDYLAIGIEVNEIHNLGQEPWQAYVTLHEHVYLELKKEHKDLPIFASWTLHHMFQKRGAMLAAWKELMPHNDLVAVSYYPFMVPEQHRLEALDWMTDEFDVFEKRYAFVETNDAAERLPLPEFKVVIEGTPQKQEAYYRKLLGLALEREFEFVVSFIHQDYDALWAKIKSFAPEAFIAWRDCGLVDEHGRARPAYQVWKDYFELPLKK